MCKIDGKYFQNGSLCTNQCIMMGKRNYLQHSTEHPENWRLWGSENPHIQMVAPLHSQHLAVWFVTNAKRIIILIFRTVTGASCWQLLSKGFGISVHHHQVINIYWFMQSSAHCCYVSLWSCWCVFLAREHLSGSLSIP